MDDTVDLTFLARLLEQSLAEQRQLRKEVGDVRSLVLQNVDYSRRVDRRMNELRDDLHLAFKSELMGAMTNLEVRLGPSGRRADGSRDRPGDDPLA